MHRKEFFLTMLVVLCSLLIQPPAFSQGVTEVHHQIVMKGAKWQAGETSVSNLSLEEKQKRAGLMLPMLTGKEPLRSLEAAPMTGLPTSFDWRNNGGNYVTPVRDQGNCGSCWAFSTTAALESATLLSNRTPGVDLNLSEQVLVSCGGSGGCGGGYIDSASNFIRSTGLPLESCYSYTATDGYCGSACSNWQSSTYRISNWQYVATTQPTVEAIKNALVNYGPLVTTYAVYSDFYYYQGGVYSYVSGYLVGYHGVLIVGYDDFGGYFIVKNSWGAWWGEAGYFRIAYSELNSPVGFGDYTIAYTGSTPACSYNVGQPNPNSFPVSGGSGTISVSAGSGCSWSATSNDNWITITSGASGTGNGTVSFAVAANQGSGRTGTLKIAGQTLSVTQDASSSCSFSIYPAQQSFDSGGGAGSVGVTAGAGCAWTAQSNVSWLAIAAGGSGSGTGTVVYSVYANSSAFSRTGTLTIAGKTFTVNQAGVSDCPYTINPVSSSFVADGGVGLVSVTTTSACNWTTVSNASWITVISGQNGSGNGTVLFSVAANNGASRNGTLTVAGKTFPVSQAGGTVACSYIISPTSNSFGASGGSGSVSVNSAPGCGWTAGSNAYWITITSGQSGSGTGTVNYSVAANGGTSSRSGTLTIAGNTFTVSQQGGGGSCTYTISPTSNSFGASGGSGSVSVNSASGCGWTAGSNASWITITSGQIGSGTGTVNYSVAANDGTSSRSGTLTIAGNTFTVNQEGGGGNCTYSISPAYQYVTGDGGPGVFNVISSSGCSWSAVSNASWITIDSGGTGSGSGRVSYWVEPNDTNILRSGSISVGGKQFSITQFP